MPKPDKHQACAICGHAKFLHSGMNGECDACDSPEVPMAKKCPGFKDDRP